MLEHATGTASFFQAMAPIQSRLLVHAYGLYTWGVYPLGKA